MGEREREKHDTRKKGKGKKRKKKQKKKRKKTQKSGVSYYYYVASTFSLVEPHLSANRSAVLVQQKPRPPPTMLRRFSTTFFSHVLSRCSTGFCGDLTLEKHD